MADVPLSNRRTVHLGGTDYELEASLGAMATYRDEFLGKVDAPYRGILDRDLLVAYRAAQETVEDEDGNAVTNPEYRGIDTTAVVRLMWAMAWAAGGTKKRFDAFVREVTHLPVSAIEEAALFATVVYDLGGNVIFRVPEGPGGTGEADEAEA